ncbi:hypothetical protein F4775DRAFT_265286 [Biscogniauxia sp. FL1348]|nr:hypothetical protein F4775DRAFT_265286 [Biscogniauxia sp. FL1348]
MFHIAGSGKTMLISLIINALKKATGGRKDVACVYFYFEQCGEHPVLFAQIWFALLKQLLQASGDHEGDAKAKFDDSLQDLDRPRLFDYLELFKSQASAMKTIYLVIDALDSCKDSRGEKTRQNMEDALKALPDNIRVLFTSRTGWVGVGIREVEKLFITPKIRDVKIYVRKRIEDNSLLSNRFRSGQDRDRVVNEVTCMAVSVSSFLLAKLYVDNLLSNISAALEQCPNSSSTIPKASTSQITQNVHLKGSCPESPLVHRSAQKLLQNHDIVLGNAHLETAKTRLPYPPINTCERGGNPSPSQYAVKCWLAHMGREGQEVLGPEVGSLIFKFLMGSIKPAMPLKAMDGTGSGAFDFPYRSRRLLERVDIDALRSTGGSRYLEHDPRVSRVSNGPPQGSHLMMQMGRYYNGPPPVLTTRYSLPSVPKQSLRDFPTHAIESSHPSSDLSGVMRRPRQIVDTTTTTPRTRATRRRRRRPKRRIQDGDSRHELFRRRRRRQRQRRPPSDMAVLIHSKRNIKKLPHGVRLSSALKPCAKRREEDTIKKTDINPERGVIRYRDRIILFLLVLFGLVPSLIILTRTSFIVL